MTETTTTTQQANPAPGTIAHTEFISSDLAQSREFLRTVFGWTFEEMPSPDGTPYVMCSNNGIPVGGLRSVAEGEPGPATTSYVTVEDINATLATVAENGGSVIVPVQEVPGMGSFAWCQAPGGFVVAVWQPSTQGN